MSKASVSASSRSNKRRRRPKFFISYRRSDSRDIAGRLYDHLVLEFTPAQIVKDVYSIPAGADFRAFLEHAIPACAAVLLLIGPDWQTSKSGKPKSLGNALDVIRLEAMCAFKHGLPVIPVLVGGADMPLAGELPKCLRKLAGLNAVPLRSGRDFHRDVADLMAQLHSFGGAPRAVETVPARRTAPRLRPRSAAPRSIPSPP